MIINVNKSADSLNKESQELLKLDMHAADIYNLITKGEIGAYSDHRHTPVILNK